MAELQEPHTPPPDRTRRAAIFATVGIVAILGLALFFAAVVAPLWQTHKAVREVYFLLDADWGRRSEADVAKALLDRLGGPERAVDRLIAYRRLPDWMKPDHAGATYLLGWCGPRAVPALLDTLKDDDPNICFYAACALATVGPEAVPSLVEALRDENEGVRWGSAVALGRIGPKAKEAVPALEKSLKDEKGLVRSMAAYALTQIRTKIQYDPEDLEWPPPHD